ncbi:OstA-like protein [Blattabacterium cuenoti]|uniref:OstA-like protein n=1 Tax=Blattabacterium cuenoti TaxID=1653831 RepID=UPI001EEA3E0C|nr:OstA-like protein [Blattabacterium cuenoti]
MKKKIQIIHTDFIQKNEKHYNNIILTGHVHLKYSKYHLFCDKAIFYKKKNKFSGYGNIQLLSNNNRIYSKKIEYSKNILKVSKNVVLFQDNIKLMANAISFNLRKKYFQADQNVILFFKKLKLSTNILKYDFQLKKVFYKKGGSISYRDFLLSSKEGSYFLKKEKIELNNEIKLVNKNYTIFSKKMECFFQLKKLNFYSPTIVIYNNQTNNFLSAKADPFLFGKKIFFTKKFRIHYNGKIIKGECLFLDYKKKYGFIKNVFFEDPKIGYLIGGYGDFDLNSGFFSLKENPTAIIKIYKDSIYIRSDTIEIAFLKKKSSIFIKAFPIKNIFFRNKVIQGKCSLLKYELSNNSNITHLTLNGNPIFWINNNQQITGDDIHLFTKDGIIDSLDMTNVFFIKKINSEKFHQIQGEKMTGFFRKENMEKILIKGNAKSIIFFDSTWINKSSCGMISLDFEKEKELIKVSYLKKVYSELFYFPFHILFYKENLFLPKFSWKEKEREEIKTEKNSLLKQIEKYKKKLN